MSDYSCSCDACACKAPPSSVNQQLADHPWLSFWRKEKAEIISAAVCLTLFALTLAFGKHLGKALPFLFGALLIASGWRVFRSAGRSLAKGHGLDETFLMSVAAIGAFIIGQYPEGIAVMLFYQIGELFQAQAVNTSKNAIAALVDMRPKMVHLIADDDDASEVIESGDFTHALIEKPAAQTCVGSLILVKPGEQIPLDGVIVKGSSTLNTALLTGESLPRQVDQGEQISAGCINISGPLYVQTTCTFENSAIAKILALLQESQANKSSHEVLIRRFARVYTPIVVAAAVVVGLLVPTILALPFVGVGSFTFAFFSTWVYRALVFLVVSCPCALVITVPLTYFASLGACAKQGMLVKGETYIEQLAQTTTCLFDKTGTLTLGQFEVTHAETLTDDFSEEELYAYLFALEQGSTHPLAQAIASYAQQRLQQSFQAHDVKETAGRGVQATVNGRAVLAGNAEFLGDLGEAAQSTLQRVRENAQGSLTFMAVDGTLALALELSDTEKSGAHQAIRALKQAGIKTVMLTGDEPKAAQLIGAKLGIDTIKSKLLPQDKVDTVAQYVTSQPGRTIFVGDGINDAPSLARADVGIAMGGLGSDAAIQASDVVFTHDDIAALPKLIAIAKRTVTIAWQNIGFALGIKLLILVLAVIGFASMWAAVFADVGVTILLIFNALRMLRVKG